MTAIFFEVSFFVRFRILTPHTGGLGNDHGKVKQKIRDIVGTDHVLDSDLNRFGYSYDSSFVPLLPANKPDLVVRPLTTEEVSRVMAVACEHEIPVTPRGAASGRTGGSIPLKGGISLCLGRVIADRRTRRAQHDGDGGGGGAHDRPLQPLRRKRALLSARPGKLEILHHRRQRGGKRRGDEGRQVRRDEELRHGAGGGSGRRRHPPDRRQGDQERDRLRSDEPLHRFRGNARRRHPEHSSG